MTSVTYIYDKYYPNGDRARTILLKHSRSVADLALQINENKGLNLNPEEVETAAMLHDIGIFMTDAPSIGCYGTNPYICHGVLGANLLRKENVDETVARVAQRHTGAGITPDDINKYGLPLNENISYMPETMLEKLICYADKFYSKSGDMQKKDLERVRASMLRRSAETLQRFEQLHKLFG